MFRFTKKPSSRSHSQYLAKITYSVECEYMEVVQTLSVLWLHSMRCEACVHSTHA
jgi:Ni,Fe-hydrogenase I small subunit